MGIKITNGVTKPSLVYDRFFLEKLELSQKSDIDETKPPYYVLRVYYRMYAVDENNRRHFELKTTSFEINDYAAVAYAKAIAGDPDLANAAAAIENALAKIIIDQKPELGEATVI